MKPSTTTYPRIGIVASFITLATAVVCLVFVATWAHTKQIHPSLALDLLVAAIVGGGVWAAKRQVLRLRGRGRNAAGIGTGAQAR